MKNFIIFWAILFAGACLSSCSKTVDVKNASLIVGKWEIKSDTTESGVSGYDAGKPYISLASDYFDFRTNNQLYIKEGAAQDTFSYKIISDTTISISVIRSGGIVQNCDIRSLSSTGATLIFTPTLVNQPWNYTRIVYLKR